MTAMNSDSESQDSDDGRRFRFEATRKDAVTLVDTTHREKSPKKTFKHKSRCESSRHRDRKERSKHESSRKTDEKDVRHCMKYSKHESKSWRQEDGKAFHKDYRDHRDTGSAVNNRSSKNFSSGSVDTKERSWDLKRQWDRDRHAHRAQRSREHSYERNYDERVSSSKHRSRETHKYHSHHKSRSRSHQSNKARFSESDRSRDDHVKCESSRQISTKEDKSQISKDQSSPRVEPSHSNGDGHSIVINENIKNDSLVDTEEYKELDLSEFDVLSEIDENMSDNEGSDSPNNHKIQLKRQRSRNESDRITTRNNDLLCSSNNNPNVDLNSSTDSLIKKTCMDFEREKSEYCEEERKISCNSKNEHLNIVVPKKTKAMYGPFLPTEFSSNIAEGEKEKDTFNLCDDTFNDMQVKATLINNDVCEKRAPLIGPCLPQSNEIKNISTKSGLNLDCQYKEHKCAEDYAALRIEATFGPALPPHLLQQKLDNDMQDDITRPILSSTTQSSNKASEAISESDEDDAIGPLPMDHPAMRNSRVHEQLELRAQKFKEGGFSKEFDITNKREEWMTELPPAQAATLGLGPRKFKLREGPDMSDRSCWTDTPVQKAQKRKDLEMKRFGSIEQDKKHMKLHKTEAENSRKHERSLLEIHQSNIQKKKMNEKKEAKLTERTTRRPFDRDIDLQMNRLDKEQRKTILMKAQLLDDRFSRGQI